MCVITAGGAGDEGPVLESASPLLPLLWAEDFDGDQSYLLFFVVHSHASDHTWDAMV